MCHAFLYLIKRSSWKKFTQLWSLRTALLGHYTKFKIQIQRCMYVKSIYSYSSHTAFSKALGDNNFSQAEKFRRPCVMGRGNGKGKWEGEGSRGTKQQKWRKEGVKSKRWCLSHKFFYVFFSVTQSLFLLGFSWSSDITASNKKSTSKKKPTSVSEITI